MKRRLSLRRMPSGYPLTSVIVSALCWIRCSPPAALSSRRLNFFLHAGRRMSQLSASLPHRRVLPQWRKRSVVVRLPLCSGRLMSGSTSTATSFRDSGTLEIGSTERHSSHCRQESAPGTRSQTESSQNIFFNTIFSKNHHNPGVYGMPRSDPLLADARCTLESTAKPPSRIDTLHDFRLTFP